MTSTANSLAEKEKRDAAFSSVLAAVLLTGLKLVVGLLTGSLGILAEAAHSGLDLVAALVTFFAVRISDRPPDERHLYGHGKVENLSALVEQALEAEQITEEEAQQIRRQQIWLKKDKQKQSLAEKIRASMTPEARKKARIDRRKLKRRAARKMRKISL